MYSIIVVVAVIGTIIGFYKSRGTLEGASSGFMITCSVMLDIFFLGVVVYGVIWLIRLMF